MTHRRVPSTSRVAFTAAVLLALAPVGCRVSKAPTESTGGSEADAASAPAAEAKVRSPTRTVVPNETARGDDPGRADAAPEAGTCFGLEAVGFGGPEALEGGRVVVTPLEGMRRGVPVDVWPDQEMPLEIEREGFVLTLGAFETLRKASEDIARDSERFMGTSGARYRGERMTLADGTAAYLSITEPERGRQNAYLCFADETGVVSGVMSQVWSRSSERDPAPVVRCDDVFRRLAARVVPGDKTWDLTSPSRVFAGRRLPKGYYQYTLRDPDGNAQEHAGIFTRWGTPRVELVILHGGPLYDYTGPEPKEIITGRKLVGIPVEWRIDVRTDHGERYWEARAKSAYATREVQSPLGAEYAHDLEATVIAPDRKTLLRNLELLE